MLLEEPATEAITTPLSQATLEKANLLVLLDRHADFLAFVQRRVQDHALAEDILQAAYVRAIKRAGGVRDQSSVVPWFYAVLRNVIIDHARSRQSEHKALERWAAELEQDRGGIRPNDQLANGIVCPCIEKLLPVLRLSYAEILREVDLGGRTLADFATAHKLKPGNAAVRAHRARAALKQELIRTCGVCSVHRCLDCTCNVSRAASPSLE